MTPAEIQAAVADLDRRAKTINEAAFVTLTIWPTRLTATIHSWRTSVPRLETNDPAELIAHLSAILDEHDPVLLAKTIGCEAL
jgi:hypothetical protein